MITVTQVLSPIIPSPTSQYHIGHIKDQFSICPTVLFRHNKNMCMLDSCQSQAITAHNDSQFSPPPQRSSLHRLSESESENFNCPRGAIRREKSGTSKIKKQDKIID